VCAAPVRSIYAAPGDTAAVGQVAVPMVPGPNNPHPGSISDDGRFVVFASTANGIVSGDTNNRSDVFLHDRQANTTIRLSASFTDPADPSGSNIAAEPSISGDGRYVVFLATPPIQLGTQVVLYDRMAGTQQTIYTDPSNPIVAAISSGAAATAISPDGRHVLFRLFDLKALDRQTDETEVIWSRATTPPFYAGAGFGTPGITPNGRFVVYEATIENDSNYHVIAGGPASGQQTGADVFVYDRWLGINERISVATEGDESTAEAFGGSISADGRYVAFYTASPLTAGETGSISDVYVRDRWLGTTERVSVAANGQAANGNSIKPVISASGRFVTFRSEATNLIAGDNNGLADVFVYDRQSRSLERASIATDGSEANAFSDVVAASADGNFTLFATNATTLVPGAPGASLFVHERTFSPEPVWRSSDVDIYNDGISQATVTSFADKSADLEFYESTDDFGIAKNYLLGTFTDGGHPFDFNHINRFWSVDGYYPYAGKSVIGRGGHDNETNVAAPFGQRDMQMHPPIDDHNVIAAFIVPENGTYSVSGLGIRRLEANGQTARLRLFNPQGAELANLQASNNQAWVRSGNTYQVGTLCAGDRIYFAIHNDGDWEWDATSISWEIKQNDTESPAQCPAQ